MDKNELALYQEAKNSQSAIKIFLTSSIGITSKIFDFDDTALIVADREGNKMCVSFDSICSVAF